MEHHTTSADITSRVNVNIRLSTTLLARLNGEAQRRVLSRTFLIERALEQFLDQPAVAA